MDTKKTILSILLIILVAFFAGCETSDTDNSKLPIDRIHGTAVIDVSNFMEKCGLADYVFVAKVEKLIDVSYRDKVTVEREDGFKTLSTPVTEYEITVIDNIKGKLKKNKPIRIFKQGGLSEDGNSYVLFENDLLPEEGKYYIFFAGAQQDDWIGVSGSFVNIEIPTEFEKNIKASSIYKEIVQAFNNEIKFESIRYTTSYEE